MCEEAVVGVCVWFSDRSGTGEGILVNLDCEAASLRRRTRGCRRLRSQRWGLSPGAAAPRVCCKGRWGPRLCRVCLSVSRVLPGKLCCESVYPGLWVSAKRAIRRAPGIRAAVITKYPAGARSALVLLRLRGISSLAIGPSGAKRPTQNEQY